MHVRKWNRGRWMIMNSLKEKEKHAEVLLIFFFSWVEPSIHEDTEATHVPGGQQQLLPSKVGGFTS